MLTLLSSDEFADWFAGLDDADAEEVATGLELIQELGPERAPPCSSELLLWYQDTNLSQRFQRSSAAFLYFAEQLLRLTKQLESEPVQSRLRQLPHDRAAEASAAIERIRSQARRRRMRLRSGNFDQAQRALDEVGHQYASVFRTLGLVEPREAANGSALRELSLCRNTPGMRVLYGVDVPNARALLVLGERLDRRAYGPAVRRALSRWQQFLSAGSDADAAWPLQHRGRM
jgi:hypothetical protein